VYKDTVTLAAALTFWLQLETYLRVILVVCSLHVLFPYEVDLFESSEAFLIYSAWLTDDLLPAALLVSLLLGLVHTLNGALGTARRAWRAVLILSICVVHAVLVTCLG